MKNLLHVLFIISSYFTSCTSNAPLKTMLGKLDKDSLELISHAIEYFNASERSSLDSVKKYQLDSLYLKCRKLLYGVYGRYSLLSNSMEDSITLGECNIRLSRFKNISDNKKFIGFDVFVNDSIPVTWKYKSPILTEMVLGFEINLKNRVLTKAIINENTWMEMKEIEHTYDSLRKDKM